MGGEKLTNYVKITGIRTPDAVKETDVVTV
jgi:hypothetical protein